MEAFIVYLIIFAIILRVSLKKKGQSGKGNAGTGRSAGNLQRPRRSGPARSTDGHVLRGKNDITCRQFGHNHPEESEPRFIVHDDPEDGFIILNGVKMRISEADKYENSI